MVDVGQLGASVTQGFTGILGPLMKYLGYLIWGMLVLGGMWGMYILTQFKYKYMYAEVGPGGSKRVKKDRIRPIKEKGIYKWKLLWSKDKIEPFDSKYIYPGNIVFGYRADKDCHTPAVWNEETMEIDIIPRDVKFWQSTEIQQTALEYQDLRSRMLPVLTMLGTIIFCLILVGVTIWLQYKYIGGGLQSVSSSLSTLQNVASNVGPG